MTADRIAFYRRREQQERSIARHTADAGIASIHFAAADRYAALVQAAAPPPAFPDDNAGSAGERSFVRS